MQRRALLTRSLGAAALPVGLMMATPVVARTAAAVKAAPAAAPSPVRTAVVDVVQMPAWTTHKGQRTPLNAGDAVSAACEVETAAGAALALRLPEGSTISLGEKTRLALLQLEVGSKEGRATLRSEMNVLEGFFRFSTSPVSRVMAERQISVSLRTATLSVSGQDLWAMTDPGHDAACAYEGTFSLKTKDQGELTLNQPTAFWARFFEQPVQPVTTVTAPQLALLQKSTELQPGSGVAAVGGTWRVLALSSPDSRLALKVAGRLRALGYPARLHTQAATKDEHHETHEVLIEQLVTQADAASVLARIKAVEGVVGRVVSGA